MVHLEDSYAGDVCSFCPATTTDPGPLAAPSIWHIVGGVRKIGGNPRTQEHKNDEIPLAIRERQGNKESPKDCSHLKSCETPLHVPVRPLYRETNGHFTF
jgi:hypothetical protein